MALRRTRYWLALLATVAGVSLNHADEFPPIDSALSSSILSGGVGVTIFYSYQFIDPVVPYPPHYRNAHPMDPHITFSGQGIGYVADGGVNTPPSTSWPGGRGSIPSGGGTGLPGLPGNHHGPSPVSPPPLPEGPGSIVSIDFSGPGVSVVPEPSSVGLLLSGLGIFALLANRLPKSTSR